MDQLPVWLTAAIAAAGMTAYADELVARQEHVIPDAAAGATVRDPIS